jgi:hypothetical protein
VIAPLVDKFRPVGSEPAVMVQVKVGTPPDDTSVCE